MPLRTCITIVIISNNVLEHLFIIIVSVQMGCGLQRRHKNAMHCHPGVYLLSCAIMSFMSLLCNYVIYVLHALHTRSTDRT